MPCPGRGKRRPYMYTVGKAAAVGTAENPTAAHCQTNGEDQQGATQDRLVAKMIAEPEGLEYCGGYHAGCGRETTL